MEEFRKVLRQREWEASARRATSGKKISLTALQDLLSEGFACGAHESELYMKLDEWHKKAAQWRASALSILKIVDAAADEVIIVYDSRANPISTTSFHVLKWEKFYIGLHNICAD